MRSSAPGRQSSRTIARLAAFAVLAIGASLPTSASAQYGPFDWWFGTGPYSNGYYGYNYYSSYTPSYYNYTSSYTPYYTGYRSYYGGGCCTTAYVTRYSTPVTVASVGASAGCCASGCCTNGCGISGCAGGCSLNGCCATTSGRVVNSSSGTSNNPTPIPRDRDTYEDDGGDSVLDLDLDRDRDRDTRPDGFERRSGTSLDERIERDIDTFRPELRRSDDDDFEEGTPAGAKAEGFVSVMKPTTETEQDEFGALDLDTRRTHTASANTRRMQLRHRFGKPEVARQSLPSANDARADRVRLAGK